MSFLEVKAGPHHDYSSRIGAVNRDYNPGMQIEDETEQLRIREDQAAMRRQIHQDLELVERFASKATVAETIEQLAVSEDERLTLERIRKERAEQMQKVLRVFQERFEKGKQFLEQRSFSSAINELKEAEKMFTREFKWLKRSCPRCRPTSEIAEEYLDYKQKWEKRAPDLYATRGVAYVWDKKFEKAIKDFTFLIGIVPRQYEAYNFRAQTVVLFSQREHVAIPPSVVQDFETSLRLFPDQEITRARLFFAQADYANAIPALAGLVGRRNIPALERVELLGFLGDAYRQTEKKQEALGAYERALSILLDTDQSFEQIEILRTKKGDILLELGRDESAIVEYRKAREKNAENPLCFLPEATRGDAEKQFLIGRAFAKGSAAIARNWDKAARWLRECAPQNVKVYPYLGYMYEKGGFGLAKNLSSAVDFYITAREGNSSFRAGELLVSGGEGLEKDLQKAILLFHHAAEHAEPLSQVEAAFQLGFLLSQVEELPHDFPAALRFYQTVVSSTLEGFDNRKKGEAAYFVGIWYLEGRQGVVIHLGAALGYLGKALRAGHTAANEALARTHFAIAEGASEKSSGLDYYIVAANLGHPMAAFRAGELYRFGAKGISQNSDMARKYLQKAVDGDVQGSREALKALDSSCIIS